MQYLVYMLMYRSSFSLLFTGAIDAFFRLANQRSAINNTVPIFLEITD